MYNLATIYSVDVGVKLLFDGEETPTTKSYKYLSSYTPVEGDRVLVLEISGTHVILGKIAG